MAEQSEAAKRRARQTVVNLSLALAATVAVALVMIMITPRDDSNLIQPVEYDKVAAEVKYSANVDVIIPSGIPQGWWANAARYSDAPADGVKNWHVGFVGPKNQYLGLDEGFAVNPTWIAEKTKGYSKDGEAKPVGREVGLQKYVGITDKNKGELLWLFTMAQMSPDIGPRVVILSGTASLKELTQFADLLGFGLN